MNVSKTLGPTCMCSRHHSISLSFRFVQRAAFAYWNGHKLAGPFPDLTDAEAWVKRHLMVAAVCSMTVRERAKKCCETHPPQVGL